MIHVLVDQGENTNSAMEIYAKEKISLHVAVGVIFNSNGEVLIAQRPEHTTSAGFWEFPGGKVESYENVVDALKRELNEELNIHVQESTPIIKYCYEYPDRSVLLDVWYIHSYQGVPHGSEGQVIEWVKPEKLNKYNMLAANRAIITAIQLPSYYFITSEPENTKDFWLDFKKALDNGFTLIQLRSKCSSSILYTEIAQKALQMCKEYEARLMLNHPDSLKILHSVNADGIHFTSTQMLSISQRPVNFDYWLAASCHHLQEVKYAEGLNLDFLVLSPVLATQTHPGADVLGWASFEKIVQQANLPIYALGGMTMLHIEAAKNCGAQGIAGKSHYKMEPE